MEKYSRELQHTLNSTWCVKHTSHALVILRAEQQYQLLLIASLSIIKITKQSPIAAKRERLQLCPVLLDAERPLPFMNRVLIIVCEFALYGVLSARH